MTAAVLISPAAVVARALAEGYTHAEAAVALAWIGCFPPALTMALGDWLAGGALPTLPAPAGLTVADLVEESGVPALAAFGLVATALTDAPRVQAFLAARAGDALLAVAWAGEAGGLVLPAVAGLPLEALPPSLDARVSLSHRITAEATAGYATLGGASDAVRTFGAWVLAPILAQQQQATPPQVASLAPAPLGSGVAFPASRVTLAPSVARPFTHRAGSTWAQLAARTTAAAADDAATAAAWGSPARIG